MDNESLPFSDTMRVRFSDADAQGHLYFANYMVYADEVVTRYMEELGYGAMNPQEAPALVFTVNINCDYSSECTAGDTVHVQVGYKKLGNSSAVVAYELRAQASDELLASGSITQVFVDPVSRTSCPIPADFRAAIIARQPALA